MQSRPRQRHFEAIPSRWFVLIAGIVIACVADPAGAASDQQIGPGVAGQLHAVTFDPTDATGQTIYVGGDNFGVYKTEDLGGSWRPWNQGMQHDNPKRTSYVDDLLVVRPDPEFPGLPAGVYAATFGGIIYRRNDGAVWEHETLDLTYSVGLMEGHGGAVPFASLGFDPVAKRLYAGTGRARIDDFSHYSGKIYPIAETEDHYSLWCRSLAPEAGDPYTDWAPVVDIGGVPDGNVGQIWQIGVVLEGESGSRIVVAAETGVYIQNPPIPGSGGGGWQQIWDSNASPFLNWPSFSRNAWGVAVGGQGRVYVLTRRTNSDEKPAVWRCIPETDDQGHYTYADDDWTLLDDSNDGDIPPWDDDPLEALNWSEIVEAGTLYSLTVIPADNIADEQVFVGLIRDEGWNTNYSGYFRHGRYVDGEEKSGWVNFIARQYNGEATFQRLYYVDYLTNASNAVEITDPGWVKLFPVYSTVPLAYHPDDPNRMFAAGYHIPLIADDVTATGDIWTQRYCNEITTGFYNSRGLEEMSPRDIAFTDPEGDIPGQLVIGCGDFQAFLASDEIGTSFLDMDPYDTGNSMGRDVETVGDEIYVLRGAAGMWLNSFGYESRWDEEETNDRLSRQDHVIARYDSGGQNFYWEYLSTAFDSFSDVPPSPHIYDVEDIEFVGSDTMFAAITSYVELTAGRKYWSSLLARGTRPNAEGDWTWEQWWKPTNEFGESGSRIQILESIPGTSRLLVADKFRNVSITQLNTAQSATQAEKVWMNSQDAANQYGTTHRRYGSTRNITAMICDPAGQWLHIANKGQDTNGDDSEYCANVSRVRIPANGLTPAIGEWELLLNRQDPDGTSEGITFPAVEPSYYPDGWGVDPASVAETLPLIKSIAIHPDNPTRIFIGLRAVTPSVDESFHGNNGVYEFVPGPDLGTWQKLEASGLGDPCHGVNKLAFVPSDPTKMIAGVYGQGFFRINNVEECEIPAVEPAAMNALHPEQTLLLVQVGSTSGYPMEEVRVDASALGLDSQLLLFDDGVSGGEWLTGDGIWTADLTNYDPSGLGELPVTLSLPYVARDEVWNTATGEFELTVLESPPAVYYYNGSRESGLDYPGQPSGIAAIDLPTLGGGPSDLYRDTYISRFEQDGMIAYSSGRVGDVPTFDDQSDFRFLASEPPAPNHAPATAVDLDNDGLQDLVIPAGNSGEGVLIYRQNPGTGAFDPTDWLELGTDLQQHTWTAACADYDGDGQIDIYLCRAMSSGNQLPRSGTAVADVLLRNDLANSGRFIDVSQEIEIPLDDNQDPLHLVSRTAAWCDHDQDGDPDLAVADCVGRGFYVYENDPVPDQPRFRISYPDDPGSTGAFNTSDLTWVDHDGDGDADLLVTTFWGSGVPGEPYVYENNILATGNPFSESPLLGVAPPHATSGVRVVDANLDGCQDLMLLADLAKGSPALVLNSGTGSFSLAGNATGLGALKGVTNGGLVADLNGDGGAELFLGQPQSDRRFLAAARGTDSVSDNWIGLDLVVARGGGRFSPAYGARVQVTTAASGPGNTVAMTLGANGTEDHVLRIGFADGFTPTCEIHWPNGHVTQPDLSGDLHTVTRLEQPDEFEITAGSVTGRPEMQPLSYVDFVFHWTTDHQTDPRLDMVEFDMSGPFTPPRAELHAGDPDVLARQWAEGSGQNRVFHHEIRLENQPCVNEYYTFWVHSGTATVTDSDGGGLFRVKFCTSDDPDDPQDPLGGE